jgi:hypothetical protein
MEGRAHPSAVTDPLDSQLEELQRTLMRLLAKRRIQTVHKDPELKKVQALVYELVEDIRRMRAVEPHGKEADAVLRHLVGVRERQLTERDAAWSVADGFRQALLRLGTPEYLQVQLAAEDGRRTDDEPLIEGLPREQAVEALLFAYRRRSDESRHREARRRIKARYLLHVGLLLGLLVPLLLVAADQATDLSWWTLGMSAVAGAVGATVSGLRRLRDELTVIDDLRAYRPAMLVQPLVGAAFALVLVMVLKAGLLAWICRRVGARPTPSRCSPSSPASPSPSWWVSSAM